MLLDSRIELHSPSPAFGPIGRRNVGNVIDLSSGERSLCADLYLVVRVAETFVGPGASLRIHLVSSNGAIATDGTATEHFTTGDFKVAALTAGATLLTIRLRLGGDCKRYIGLQVTGIGAQTTAGKLHAFLTPDPSNWRSTPNAI